jgi:hypothetical protein
MTGSVASGVAGAIRAGGTRWPFNRSPFNCGTASVEQPSTTTLAQTLTPRLVTTPDGLTFIGECLRTFGRIATVHSSLLPRKLGCECLLERHIE